MTFSHELCLMTEVPESGISKAVMRKQENSSGTGLWHRAQSGTALPSSYHLKQVLGFQIF